MSNYIFNKTKHCFRDIIVEYVGNAFTKQVPNGVSVVRVLMLAAFLRSSCIRLLYLALQSKMLRSMAGRSQGQSAMTGRFRKTFVLRNHFYAKCHYRGIVAQQHHLVM